MHHWEMSPSGVVLRGGSKCSRNLLTSLQTTDDSDISSLDILATDVDGHDGYWCLEPRGQRRVGDAALVPVRILVGVGEGQVNPGVWPSDLLSVWRTALTTHG